MIYYSVGKPICYEHGSYTGISVRRDPTKIEVKESLLSQKNIRIFFSYEDAKNYALSLHEVSDLKSPLKRNKMPPIIHLSLKDDTLMESLLGENVTIIDYSTFLKESKQVTIKYAETSPSNILKIIESEFTNTLLPTYNFEAKSHRCNLL